MKAITRDAYGPPEILQTVEVDAPVPKAGEVRLRVHATSVNASDVELLTGNPLYGRVTGLFNPGVSVLGSDVAGVVEATGNDVTRFAVGDALFGDIFETFGGFAEMVCVPEHQLIRKPPGISFDEAAALPQSGLIALQGIRDTGAVEAGKGVLINGAGGGGGSFAVQIAKHLGATVTAVDSAEKLELVRTLGADRVVDFAQQDVTRSGDAYDLILDLAGQDSVWDFRRILRKGGRYLVVGGPTPNVLKALVFGPLVGGLTGKKLGMLLHKPNRGLEDLVTLVEAGAVVPAIDRVFGLDETAAALRYFLDGHVKGKIVISPR